MLGGASLAVGTTLSGCGSVVGQAGGSDVVTVGVLEDRSGNFQALGTPKWQASRLAIDEINADGGILGREVEVVDPDPESDNDRYQRLTKRLITDEEVDALWAGYASSTREAIRPIVERHGQLYFYTTQYEGGVCDRYTFPVGATARQQLGVVLPYLVEEYGPRIYTLAANYNFGHLSADWVQILAAENDATVVAEEYLPLGQSDFGALIDRIEAADPDVIMSMLVGGNHTAFYEQRAERGLDVPMGTSTAMAQAHEHLQLDPPAMAGVHVGVNYMQEIPTDRNRAFVDRFYEAYPDANYLNQEAENNYFSTYMYRQAVEAAGTTDQAAVIDELESGIEVAAPEGDVSLDGGTHHVNHIMRVARADRTHDISFVDQRRIDETFLSETVGCDLRETPETRQYVPSVFYPEVT